MMGDGKNESFLNYNIYSIIMEKIQYKNTNYKSVSALESRLLNRISGSGMFVFGVSEAQRLSGFSNTRVHNLLASLAKKGIIVKILRNKYCLEETLSESRFAVATAAFIPSYVSFWSGLSFYGFTEQQPSVVQIAVPKQFKKVQLREIRIQPISVKPENFSGYIRREGFSIASKEKVLVDSAASFENVGGFAEFVKCLRNAWGEIDKRVFVKLLLKVNNKSFNSRIGYLVEELGLSLSRNLLKRIHTRRSSGFVKLNPAKSKSSKYNKRWNIIVNDSIEEGGLL